MKRALVMYVKNIVIRAGALVLWLCEETCVPKVASLNPSTIYWMYIFNRYLVWEL